MAGAILATRGEGNQEREGESGADIRIAWPSIEAGGIPPEGGIDASFKSELETVPEGPERDALRQKVGLRDGLWLGLRLTPFLLVLGLDYEQDQDPAERDQTCGEVS